MVDERNAAERPAIPPVIRAGRLIAIARGLRAALLAHVAAALRAVGVHAFEATLDSPDGLDGIAAAAVLASTRNGIPGPAFLRGVQGPLALVPLVPARGISAENAGAFIAASSAAVGVGEWLMGSRTPATIREPAATLVRAVAAAVA